MRRTSNFLLRAYISSSPRLDNRRPRYACNSDYSVHSLGEPSIRGCFSGSSVLSPSLCSPTRFQSSWILSAVDVRNWFPSPTRLTFKSVLLASALSISETSWPIQRNRKTWLRHFRNSRRYLLRVFSFLLVFAVTRYFSSELRSHEAINLADQYII